MANALSSEEVFQSIQSNDSYSIKKLFQMLKPAICVLLDKGIKIVLVTLGSNGVFLCFKGFRHMKLGLERTTARPYGFGKQLYETITSSCPSNRFLSAKESEGTHLYAVHFPALPASVVKLTGAGDCLVGGTLASICAGLDVFQSVAVGIAAAKAAVESQTNVPNEYSSSTIAGMCVNLLIVIQFAAIYCTKDNNSIIIRTRLR